MTADGAVMLTEWMAAEMMRWLNCPVMRAVVLVGMTDLGGRRVLRGLRLHEGKL